MQTRLEAEKRVRMYRFYVADGLKAIGGFDTRYYDLITSQPETRTADEIKTHIKNKLKAIGG